jgi:pimeloyl-ACP methyl ester carboxylesterase
MARARAEGVAAYAAGFSEKFFAHDAGVAARLGPATREAMAAAPLDVLERQARALDARRAMIPRIEGFAAPVEVMAGGADRICPAKLHPPIAEACADARLTELPGVGHLVTLEAPEAVTARIDALMERIGG